MTGPRSPRSSDRSEAHASPPRSHAVLLGSPDTAGKFGPHACCCTVVGRSRLGLPSPRAWPRTTGRGGWRDGPAGLGLRVRPPGAQRLVCWDLPSPQSDSSQTRSPPHQVPPPASQVSQAAPVFPPEGLLWSRSRERSGVGAVPRPGLEPGAGGGNPSGWGLQLWILVCGGWGERGALGNLFLPNSRVPGF